jgi:hypothetical protein
VNDLYLRKHFGGGVISYAKLSDGGVFIIGLYCELIKIQDLGGEEGKQNLGLVIKAVDHVRRHIIELDKEKQINLKIK